MRVSVRIDSATEKELRAFLRAANTYGITVTVGLNGPEKYTAESAPVSDQESNTTGFLTHAAHQINDVPERREIIRECDPELERLLAEEEEIERQART